MINMKDLIKKQTNLIRRESGMNIKEYLKPSSGKPEKGDYVRDGKDFGKITTFWKKEALVEPIPKKKGVTWVYNLKYLKDSGKR